MLFRSLAQQVGGVVHPTLYWGTERERTPQALRNLGFKGHEWIVGMDFPDNAMRSYYAPEEQFGLVVRWTLENLMAHGFKLIVVVNGHGATNQIETLKRLVAELNARGPARLLYTFTLDYVTTEPGHATLTEAAAILSMDPARVDLGTLPPADKPLRIPEWAIADDASFNGHSGLGYTVNPEADPRRGTAEIGKRNFDAALTKLAEIVGAAWANLA